MELTILALGHFIDFMAQEVLALLMMTVINFSAGKYHSCNNFKQKECCFTLFLVYVKNQINTFPVFVCHEYFTQLLVIS